jgi:dihydrofolate reductase
MEDVIISAIVAASTNYAIGKNNQLLWHLPNDLKFFKNTTWGHPVIMGFKTFDSVGQKALPGRLNIVITSKQLTVADNIAFVPNLETALTKAKQENTKEIFIAGGGQIYKQSLNICDRIYLTRVHTIIDGDVFFPDIAPQQWQLVAQQNHYADEKHAFSFSFEVWERKKA